MGTPRVDYPSPDDVEQRECELREAGSSLREIADRLNAQGFTTRRGKPWNAMHVARVLERVGGLVKVCVGAEYIRKCGEYPRARTLPLPKAGLVGSAKEFE